MESAKGRAFSTLTPAELLGPLNEVERRYAPRRLYVAGNYSLPLPAPRVAIVGTRNPSTDGVEVATRVAKALVRKGVTIVSGLALGIDTVAHTTAINEGGRTIAVLGTPLDRFYPAQNARLQEAIMQQHCAVSEFPVGFPIMKKNFVIRNRTMALMSNISIIIEGGEQSGTRHQGWEALRLGRPLFLWHKLLENPTLRWPRKMLDYGALVLENEGELFGELPPPREPVLVA